jgi:hypothetical protein
MKLFFTIIVSNLFLLSPAFGGGGHDAGRDWAEENGIEDPHNCHSAYPGRWAGDNINNSPSFTEGCLEYLRDEGITNEDDELKEADLSDEEDEESDL